MAYEKPGLLQQSRAMGVENDEIISRDAESVKSDWLNDFFVRHKLMGKEVVEAIRILYPAFDKTLLSKCCRPDKYGIQLSEKAKQMLTEVYEREK